MQVLQGRVEDPTIAYFIKPNLVYADVTNEATAEAQYPDAVQEEIEEARSQKFDVREIATIPGTLDDYRRYIMHHVTELQKEGHPVIAVLASGDGTAQKFVSTLLDPQTPAEVRSTYFLPRPYGTKNDLPIALNGHASLGEVLTDGKPIGLHGLGVLIERRQYRRRLIAANYFSMGCTALVAATADSRQFRESWLRKLPTPAGKWLSANIQDALAVQQGISKTANFPIDTLLRGGLKDRRYVEDVIFAQGSRIAGKDLGVKHTDRLFWDVTIETGDNGLYAIMRTGLALQLKQLRGKPTKTASFTLGGEHSILGQIDGDTVIDGRKLLISPDSTIHVGKTQRTYNAITTRL